MAAQPLRLATEGLLPARHPLAVASQGLLALATPEPPTPPTPGGAGRKRRRPAAPTWTTLDLALLAYGSGLVR
jgi:hypothetical protein